MFTYLTVPVSRRAISSVVVCLRKLIACMNIHDIHDELPGPNNFN